MDGSLRGSAANVVAAIRAGSVGMMLGAIHGLLWPRQAGVRWRDLAACAATDIALIYSGCEATVADGSFR